MIYTACKREICESVNWMLLVYKFARVYNLDWHMIKLGKNCILIISKNIYNAKEDKTFCDEKNR